MEELEKFYKGKRILITGHTGFKGSWLVLWLLELGAEVWGYSLPPETEPNLFEVLGLRKRIVHHEGDIRDLRALRKFFLKACPELVFHLAAQPLVCQSFDDPLHTFEVNVMGTVNLLECARELAGLQAIIVITSDKCYAPSERPYYHTENDPLGGRDPYSASKACAELVAHSYREAFLKSQGVGIATARAGNVIGGGDWQRDRLIPDCIKALVKGEPVYLRQPEAVRPWQHVLDVLYGYLLLGEKLAREPEKFSGPWNFGPPGRPRLKVEEVVAKVIEIWGGGSYRVSLKKPYVETSFLGLDPSKAMRELGWIPRWTLPEALYPTLEWYKNFYEDRDMYLFSRIQLRQYMKSFSKFLNSLKNFW